MPLPHVQTAWSPSIRLLAVLLFSQAVMPVLPFTVVPTFLSNQSPSRGEGLKLALENDVEKGRCCHEEKSINSFPRFPRRMAAGRRRKVTPNSIVCGVCSPYKTTVLRSSELSNDASSPNSFEGISTSQFSPPSSANPNVLQEKKDTKVGGSWRDKLLRWSNYASLICAIDCTLLPLVTVILPLFGIASTTPGQMQFLHTVSHQMAIFFIIPVGGLATTLNYTNHKKWWIAALGYMGLMAVLVASLGCQMSHGIPGPIGHFLQHWLHKLHHVHWFHRVTNITGSSLLLLSNFLSRRQKSGSSCCSDNNEAHSC